jgi:hypothetical protein
MRIEPFLHLRRRRVGQSGVALGGTVGSLALLLAGCFFELGDLAPANGGAGSIGGEGGASAEAGLGGDGLAQGGSELGGSAGALPVVCDEGQKACGDTCQPLTPESGCGDPACVPCVAPSHTLLDCSTSGVCIFAGCDANYADCDADVSSDVGTFEGNGCEYYFGEISPAPPALTVPFAPIAIDDGERTDWDGVPAYGFDQLCIGCSDTALPAVLEEAEKPSRRDLDAYFRVAWDRNFFYVLLDAFDNFPFSMGKVEGNCKGASCEDAVSVFLDGRDDRGAGYGDDNSRVFAGLSGRFDAPSQGQPSSDDVTVVSTPVGLSCYRIEARFGWPYITATKGGAEAIGHFPPAAGQSYGFDIGVNDWDPSLATGELQRQSQVFWLSPGESYGFSPAGIGSMTLSDVPVESGMP